ncbi:MAG TPA: uroporphyrinogen decarboxylase [Alphaproteobacteria bacterium]|nr:uroporphyrinogen decarboxylase [Alphaproteobacteria bacterium]
MNPSMLLKAALHKQPTPRPPLWLMRQAGRYLPEYMEVRAQHPNFMNFCLDSVAATAVTLQPVYRFNLDAAIIFADILTIPHALGHKVSFTPAHGPIVERLTTPEQVAELRQHLPTLTQKLAPVAETVMRARATLPPDKAVIGFSGAPWTLATYLLDAKPSQSVENTLHFAKVRPAAFDELIHTLTDAVTAYLHMQLAAGADVVQVFDSWASSCPPELWELAVHNPLVAIVQAIRQTSQAPVILFPRAVAPQKLEALAKSVSGQNVALSLSTEVDIEWAVNTLQAHVAIQGNLDPHLFTLDSPEPLRRAAEKLLTIGQRSPGFVLNTGHGLTPQTRIERVEELAHLVQNWKAA